MISTYANASLSGKALEFFVLMLREGMLPNMFTFSSVLRACNGLVDLRQLHYGIIKDLVVWNSIIGGLAQNSDGDEALNQFKRMKKAGFTADQATLTSVLRACTGLALLEGGSLEDAKSVFKWMVHSDVISWSTMIAGLAQNGHTGLVDDGWYYFRSMKKLYGIDPGREHYGCIIDLLGRAGKLDEAVNLVQEMECEPNAVTWRTFLSACVTGDTLGHGAGGKTETMARMRLKRSQVADRDVRDGKKMHGLDIWSGTHSESFGKKWVAIQVRNDLENSSHTNAAESSRSC
ncbi:hypothetical protein CRYUN_Cryun06bG0075900 [Craigia yunnanensis]